MDNLSNLLKKHDLTGAQIEFYEKPNNHFVRMIISEARLFDGSVRFAISKAERMQNGEKEFKPVPEIVSFECPADTPVVEWEQGEHHFYFTVTEIVDKKVRSFDYGLYLKK